MDGWEMGGKAKEKDQMTSLGCLLCWCCVDMSVEVSLGFGRRETEEMDGIHTIVMLNHSFDFLRPFKAFEMGWDDIRILNFNQSILCISFSFL